MQITKEYREYCNFCGYSRLISAVEYEELSKLDKGYDTLSCPACGAGNKNWLKSLSWQTPKNPDSFRHSPV